MTATTQFRLRGLGFLLLGAGTSTLVHYLAAVPASNMEAALLNISGALLLVLADSRT